MIDFSKLIINHLDVQLSFEYEMVIFVIFFKNLIILKINSRHSISLQRNFIFLS